ncbi:CLUMA_CG013508, isoform A [Clunio marinus]|uniref:CLUMA_CG013508, isoform A n=1 Tax=Clunio marinus TaxID=568069 RepID=A0A1J1IJ33_9DIPT|nr:CLUMA_CG013508, isoform A [Clunio marinus]
MLNTKGCLKLFIISQTILKLTEFEMISQNKSKTTSKFNLMVKILMVSISLSAQKNRCSKRN